MRQCLADQWVQDHLSNIIQRRVALEASIQQTLAISASRTYDLHIPRIDALTDYESTSDAGRTSYWAIGQEREG